MEVLPQDALWGCQIRLAFAGKLNNALAAPAGHDQGPVGTVAPVALVALVGPGVARHSKELEPTSDLTRHWESHWQKLMVLFLA